MLFNSVAFLLFFPLVVCVYFAIPSQWMKTRNLLLLGASYYFYMNWQPVYALLLLSSTVVTYGSALGMARSRTRNVRRRWLVASIVLNLSALFFFKYYNFLASSGTALLEASGMRMAVPLLDILLPVGISFYTFQALGYSVDVYRGTTPVERDFPTYALFVSFFPQLVAGPIERSSHLLPQFRQQHPFNPDDLRRGLSLMVWGYFLKLAVADRCGLYVDAVWQNLEQHNGGSYALAALLFPWQLYGDFAGYSLIAIGAARIMGFRLMENFHRPYFASTVSDFWRRWHISLSTWFKDYLYIPLGGNRRGTMRTYSNLLTTFVVSGIWHGANWTFLFWGLSHGLLMCMERALGLSRRSFSGWQRLCRIVFTFLVGALVLVLFRAGSLTDAVSFICGIVTRMGIPFFGRMEIAITMVSIMITIVVETRQEWQLRLPVPTAWREPCRAVALALLIAYITLFGVLDSSQFLYFQF